ERQAYIHADPLSLRKATARLLMTSKRLDLAIRHAPERIKVPALLVLAERDRIIDNVPTREYFLRLASHYKAIIEFAGTHPPLEFEPNPAPIFDDIIAGLDRLLDSLPRSV